MTQQEFDIIYKNKASRYAKWWDLVKDIPKGWRQQTIYQLRLLRIWKEIYEETMKFLLSKDSGGNYFNRPKPVTTLQHK